MKRNGFTLVELLAVIAILAILVIIALPNVLKMFNDSKKNSFLIEAKTLYSEASKKYITESVKGNKISYISSEDNTKLSMTGKQLQYCIKVDSNGKIISMKVGNGEYFIQYDGAKDITKYTINDITNGTLDNYACTIDYSKIKLTLGDTATEKLTMTLDTSDQDVGTVTYKINFLNTSRNIELTSDDYKNKYYIEYTDFTYNDQYSTIQVTAVIDGKEFSKKSIGPACFVKGTKVKTENGFKNIEEIKLNEKIYSYNLNTNELELKKVVDTVISQTKETYIITINNETFEVTPRHHCILLIKVG